MRLLVAALWCALFLDVPSLFGQSGVQVGSSAGAFATGVSLARDAEAAFWNPALLGLQPFGDVRVAPSAGLRLLGLSVSSTASAAWVERAARVGLLGRSSGATAPLWSRLVAPGGGSESGGAADLVWISSANSSVSVSLVSHIEGSGQVGAAGDSVRRSASTYASLSVATPVGMVGGMRARAGMTVKGRWVHVHGAGVWADSSATGTLFRETLLTDVPGASADLGVVLQPGRFVISAVLSDAIRLTVRPASGARIRTVMFDDSGHLEDVAGPDLDVSDPVADRSAAEVLYNATVPPVVGRIGVSWGAAWGEPAFAVERRLRDGALQIVPSAAWAASFTLPPGAPAIRVGLTGGSRTSGIQVAWISRNCRTPWALSAGKTRRSIDATAAVAFSLSFGTRSLGACSGSPQ